VRNNALKKSGYVAAGTVGARLDAQTQRMLNELRAAVGVEPLARKLQCGVMMLYRLENAGTATPIAVQRLTGRIRDLHAASLR
jgi:hypothetical protein